MLEFRSRELGYWGRLTVLAKSLNSLWPQCPYLANLPVRLKIFHCLSIPRLSKSSKSFLPCCLIVEGGIFTSIYGKALSRLLNFHVKSLYFTFVSGMNLSHICSRILALSMFSENVLILLFMANIFYLILWLSFIDCFKYILLHLCVCLYMHVYKHAHTCTHMSPYICRVREQLRRVVSVLTWGF